MDNEKEKLLQTLQKAVLALETTRHELKLLKQQQNESIAIIGMGCRFPGGANNPEAFWELLKQGYDSVCEIPKARWNPEEYYDPDPEKPNKMYVREGAFLNVPIDQFDAPFFGISPREAEWMDPQQRLLLEVSWEALENAGINPKSLNNSHCGVFMGVCFQDYRDLLIQAHGKNIEAYFGTGNENSILSGRLSYFFGLQGPSLTLDTACSSSLVTVHEACKSLRLEECHLALAGGVNLLLNPDWMVNFCKAHMLATDGRCKTFDARANGYGRGEGCGVVILKRLSDALNEGDRILSIIRASDVNQDGTTSGLTVPNGEAQASLIRSALKHAELKASAIDYIETHGTGTPLGDPIEVGALEAVFAKTREKPLLLGTVKTNIGHLESAAGIAGLIKVVLALVHEAIPTHLHFEKLNPHIHLDQIPAKIPLELTPWPRSDRPRLAGISSFGFSGTNAHAIIEESPKRNEKPVEKERPLHVLALSAKNEASLLASIALYQKHLVENPKQEFADIAYTANAGRAHFEERVAFVASSQTDLLHLLQKGDYKIIQASAKPLKIAFLFAGEGSQNSKMGQKLYDTQPVFKEAIDRVSQLLALDKPLTDLLFKEEHAQTLNQTGNMQPALFAFEYALAELWKSWGILPDYVLGHSGGEYAAATVAGMLSLEDGLKLISVRERLMQALPKVGAMGAVTPDLQEEFRHVAESITYHTPKFGFVSNLTGQLMNEVDANYWVQNIHSPMKFCESIQYIYAQGCDLFLEMGPDSVLIDMGMDCLPEIQATWLPSLKRGFEEWKTLLDSLSQLYLRGAKIDWTGFDKPYPRQKLSLPTYPFQRESYWIKTATPVVPRDVLSSSHPMLLRQMDSHLATIFETEINETWPDFIEDHKIYEHVVVAGATYVSTLLSIAKTLFNQTHYQVVNVEFLSPLILQAGESCIVQSLIHPLENDKRYFEILSRPKNAPEAIWTLHTKGWLKEGSQTSLGASENIPSILALCPTKYSKQELYERILEFGLALGDRFQWIESLFVGENEVLARLRLPKEIQETQFILPPGMIDACFQVILGKILKDKALSQMIAIPFSIQEFSYDESLGKPVWIHGIYHSEVAKENFMHMDLTLLNEEGKPLGHILDFVARSAPKETLLKGIQSDIQNWFYEIIWEPRPLSPSKLQPIQGKWLVFADSEGLVDRLLDKIKSPDCHPITIQCGNQFLQIGEDHYQINPKNGPEMVEWIQDRLSKETIVGIIDLWPLNKTDSETKNLLFLFQAMMTAKLQVLPDLWLITNNIQPLGNSPIHLNQTPLNGLRKTALLEYPELTCRQIDVDSLIDPEQHGQLLLQEMQSLSIDDQVAYREGVRYVPRLMPQSKIKEQKRLTVPNDSFSSSIPLRKVLWNIYF